MGGRRGVPPSDAHGLSKRRFLLPVLLAGVLALTGLSSASEAAAGLRAEAPALASAGPSTATFRFAAVGDHGAGAATRAVFNRVGARGPDFFLSLGDLSYDKLPATSWCQMVKDEINAGAGKPRLDAYGESYPFELVQGNHDAPSLDETKGTACLPDRLHAHESSPGSYGRQYYVDYPEQAPLARFILTSPGLGYSYAAGSANYQWLSNAIDSARAAGIRWIVVGNHLNYVTAGSDKVDEVGSDYFNLLVAKKVDLVLQGHDHDYQRSKQLSLSPSCPSVPTGRTDTSCIADDGADGSYTAGAGPVLVINGAGGESNYAVDGADPEAGYFATAVGSGSTPFAGYTEFLVSESGIAGSYVGATGAGPTDSFAIGSPPPDVNPPSAPTGLRGSGSDDGTVDLSWTPATDDRGVAGYRVVRDGSALQAPVRTASLHDTGLEADSTHTYVVQALDLAGNSSAASDPVSVRIPPRAPPGQLYRETWTATDGSPWPAAWSTSAGNGTVDVRAGRGSLSLSSGSGAYARAALTKVTAVSDTELLTSYQWSSGTSAAYLNLFLRGSGGWANAYRPRTGYGVQLSALSTTAVVQKTVNGTTSTLASVASAQRVSTVKQWLRLRVTGSGIALRTWVDGTPEPTAWHYTGTDSSISGAGQLFVSQVASSAAGPGRAVTLDDLTLTDASTPAPSDTTPPSAPTGVRGTATADGTVDLVWDPASDDTGVTGYRVLRDGAVVAGVTTTAYRDSGLTPGRTYDYAVEAYDAAGNTGHRSSTASVLVPTNPEVVLHAETWPGSDGTVWPEKWTSSSASGVVDVRGGRGELGFSDAPGAYARSVLTGVAAVSDADLRMSYAWAGTTTAAYLNVSLRGTGGWANAYRPRTGYTVQLTANSSSLVVQRSSDGGTSTVATVPAGQRVTTARQWLRLRVSGSTLSVKTWLDGTPEPATWTWSGTDTGVAGAGQVYLSMVRSSTAGGSKTVTLDDLTLTRAQ